MAFFLILLNEGKMYLTFPAPHIQNNALKFEILMTSATALGTPCVKTTDETRNLKNTS